MAFCCLIDHALFAACKIALSKATHYPTNSLPSQLSLLLCLKHSYAYKPNWCLQDHLAPLGSISKQAQGMVSNASSLATSFLKSVLDDFRYIIPASTPSASHFHTPCIILMSTHTCCWRLKFRLQAAMNATTNVPTGAAAAAAAQQLKILCCHETFVSVLQRKGNSCIGAASSGWYQR